MRLTVVLVASALAAALAAVPPAAAGTGDPPVTRLDGATRIETAVAVSRTHWQQSDHAVLATAADFPDALAGAALVAALDAPLLLVEPDRLPETVARELERLGAGDVVLLGGEAAISAQVARAVGRLATRPALRRVGGADRFETAARAAHAAGGQPAEVVIASGTTFADALAAAALPADQGRLPVLLSRRDVLPGATERALAGAAPQRAVLVGGTAVLGEGAARAVAAHAADVQRLAGPDRFATSAAVLAEALERSGGEPRPLVAATGTRFPDALAAAALAARLDGVLLLVPPDRLTGQLDALLRSHRERLSSAVVVGGGAAVSPHVAAEVEAALSGRPRPLATVTSAAGFHGTARPLPAGVVERMDGVSWRPDCPVGLGDLAYLEVAHRDFDGRTVQGEMVVAAGAARDVLGVLAALYDAGFPIARMRLVDDYGADDDASMTVNNTHAFNCRRVAGTERWSEHAFGTAVDVNPVQNPYVRGDHVAPTTGRAYLDRSDVRPGMIVRPGPVVEAFARSGWGWGGDWQHTRDYHHFSASGR